MEKKKIILITAASVVGAAAAAYIGVSVYYNDRFLPNTNIDGVDVSGKTCAETGNALSGIASDYSLRITGRGDTEDTLVGSEIGVKAILNNEELESLLHGQNSFTWPVSLLSGPVFYTTTAAASFDETALKEKVASLSFLDKNIYQSPTDAYLACEDDLYVVVPETEGTEPDSDRMLAAIEASVESLSQSLDLDEAGVYKEPSVRSDSTELIGTAEEYNGIIRSFPVVAFNDTKESPDPEELVSWITDSDGTPVLDEEKIASWVSSLADSYNTIDKDRKFKDPKTHKTYTVPAGTYGWEMDVDATTKAVKEAVTAMDGETAAEITPVWKQEAVQFGDADYGDTYVAANLDDQHVYVVKDGKIVKDSDCVSGKSVVAHNTPDGMFYIFAMAKNTVLRGPGYASPVTNWMPFYHGCGFHDATWRGSFGGEIYITNGSHGCINLPLQFATELYDLVEVGTPVLVYGGLTQEDAREAGYHTYTVNESSDASTGTATSAAASSAAASASSSATAGTVTTDQMNAAVTAAQNANAAAVAANQALAEAQASGDANAIAAAQAAADQAATAAVASEAAANQAAAQVQAQQAAEAAAASAAQGQAGGDAQ